MTPTRRSKAVNINANVPNCFWCPLENILTSSMVRVTQAQDELLLHDTIFTHPARSSVRPSQVGTALWCKHAVNLQVLQDVGGHVYGSASVRKLRKKRAKHPWSHREERSSAEPFAPPEVSYVTTSGQLASGHPGYLQVSSQSWERLDPARSRALPPTVRLRHIFSKYRLAVKFVQETKSLPAREQHEHSAGTAAL